MTSITPTTVTDGDDDLANSYYVGAMNGQVGYDPDSMKKAIEEMLGQMKDIIEKGGHVSEFMTSTLMYLMQGFGGERVGQDGQNQSMLTGDQGKDSVVWSMIQRALSGGHTGASDWQDLVNLLGLDPSHPDKPIAGSILEDIQNLEKTGQISKTLYNDVTQIISTIEGMPQTMQNWLNNNTSITADQKAKIQALLNSGDILGAMYLISQPYTDSTVKPPVQRQGNPQFVDTVSSQMTTLNQQLTGASQVMSTLAKTDSKTLQSEDTAYNNYLQMLKKMNAYLVQLQRTN